MASKYLELKAQRDRIEREMEEAFAEEQEEKIDEVKELIAAFSLKPEQVFAAEQLSHLRSRRKGGTKSGAIVPPKYRNPDNPEETWGGKGGVPKWYSAQLAKGVTAKDMLIDPNDTTTARPRGRPPARANAELGSRGADAVR